MSNKNELIKRANEAIVNLFYFALEEISVNHEVKITYDPFCKGSIEGKRYLLDELYKFILYEVQQSPKKNEFRITNKIIDSIDNQSSSHNSHDIPEIVISTKEIVQFLDQFENSLAILVDKKNIEFDKIKIYQIGEIYKEMDYLQSNSVGKNLRQPINLKIKKYKKKIRTIFKNSDFQDKWNLAREFKSFKL